MVLLCWWVGEWVLLCIFSLWWYGVGYCVVGDLLLYYWNFGWCCMYCFCCRFVSDIWVSVIWYVDCVLGGDIVMWIWYVLLVCEVVRFVCGVWLVYMLWWCCWCWLVCVCWVGVYVVCDLMWVGWCWVVLDWNLVWWYWWMLVGVVCCECWDVGF